MPRPGPDSLVVDLGAGTGTFAVSEFSTYSWLLDSMLDRTGFDIVERTFRRSAYGTYTCRRRGS